MMAVDKTQTENKAVDSDAADTKAKAKLVSAKLNPAAIGMSATVQIDDYVIGRHDTVDVPAALLERTNEVGLPYLVPAK